MKQFIEQLHHYMLRCYQQWMKMRPIRFHSLSYKSHILTYWGRVTHICVSKLTIIGSDNGLSPGRRQAIISTNAEILLVRTLGTNFSEILNRHQTILGVYVNKLGTNSVEWRRTSQINCTKWCCSKLCIKLIITTKNIFTFVMPLR